MAMETELAHNEAKGTWKGRSDREHFSDLDYHCDKLKAAVRSGMPSERILEFAADVGNHAMFIADDRAALTTAAISTRQREPSYVLPPVRFWRAMLRYPRSYIAIAKAWFARRGLYAASPAPDDTY